MSSSTKCWFNNTNLHDSENLIWVLKAAKHNTEIHLEGITQHLAHPGQHKSQSTDSMLPNFLPHSFFFQFCCEINFYFCYRFCSWSEDKKVASIIHHRSIQVNVWKCCTLECFFRRCLLSPRQTWKRQSFRSAVFWLWNCVCCRTASNATMTSAF